MSKYIKKPVAIEAVQWVGNNHDEVVALESRSTREVFFSTDGSKRLTIPTLEGDHTAELNDFIIKGVMGELYPCKPDIFKKTYYTEEEYAAL